MTAICQLHSMQLQNEGKFNPNVAKNSVRPLRKDIVKKDLKSKVLDKS